MLKAGDEVHCIDKQDAIDTMLKLYKSGYEVEVNDTVIRIIGKVVVKCEHCRHCEHRNNDEPYCHHHAMVVTPDYFCADGEEGEWMP